jgi:hypothetical protein
MDYYAFLDSKNVVTELIGGREQGSDNTDWEQWYGEFRGQVCKLLRTDGFQKHYANIGYTYDSARDAFIAPQPYPSWILIEETCQWDAPVAMPTDGQRYTWNEATTSWVVNE